MKEGPILWLSYRLLIRVYFATMKSVVGRDVILDEDWWPDLGVMVRVCRDSNALGGISWVAV